MNGVSDIRPKEISSKHAEAIGKDETEVKQAKVESTTHSELRNPIARSLTAGQIENTVFKAKDKEGENLGDGVNQDGNRKKAETKKANLGNMKYLSLTYMIEV